MHCDTIAEIYERRKKGENLDLRKNGLHLDLEKMKKGDYFLQNFALFTALKNVERPFEHTCRLAETFYEEMEANKDLIGVVKTYEDIEENWKKGKMSALLTIEEGGVCQGDLMLLRFFYHLGVRMMTLTCCHRSSLPYSLTRFSASNRGTKKFLITASYPFLEDAFLQGLTRCPLYHILPQISRIIFKLFISDGQTIHNSDGMHKLFDFFL